MQKIPEQKPSVPGSLLCFISPPSTVVLQKQVKTLNWSLSTIAMSGTNLQGKYCDALFTGQPALTVHWALFSRLDMALVPCPKR